MPQEVLTSPDHALKNVTTLPCETQSQSSFSVRASAKAFRVTNFLFEENDNFGHMNIMHGKTDSGVVDFAIFILQLNSLLKRFYYISREA